jgi:two-component sensor histidine kinase
MKNKFTCFLFIFLLSVAGAYSQSPRELQLAIQRSKADSNKVHLLLKLGDYYAMVYFNQASPANIKNALNYYSQARDLSAMLKNQQLLNLSLMSIGNCDIAGYKIEEAEANYRKPISYYHQKGDLKQEAFAWSKFGTAMRQHDTLQNRIAQDCLLKAVSIYKRLNDLRDAAIQLKALALYQTYAGQLDMAELDLLQVLDLYKASGNKKLYPVYDDLSRIYKTKGNLSRQLYYLLAMINNADVYAAESEKTYYYYILAGFYKDWGSYDKALAWSQKAVENEEIFPVPFGHFDYVMQLIECLLLEKKNKEALAFLEKSVHAHPPDRDDYSQYVNKCFGDCYLALGNFQKAEFYYLKALKNYQDFNNHIHDYNGYDDIWMHEDLGDYYFRVGQFKKSAFYLGQINDVAFKRVKPAMVSKFYMSMFRTDSALHNYIPAIQYYQQYKKISDSLFNIVKSGQIADMQTKYETTQKEQSIRLLRSESKSQYAELKTLNLERNITFAGIAMLLLMGGISYRSYRNKQRSNVLLEAKQKEINSQNLLLQDLVEQKDELLADKDELLTEKDWLLKEVHHRVKNNLQIVMSLLNTQSAFLENTEAVNVLRESQNRVQSIALIHQKLYSSNNAASINMNAYIQDLLLYLRDCYGTDKRRIRVSQVVEDITLDISQAVPLGLILNESITNAIKYAFGPNGGELMIGFQKIGEGDLMLTVTDSGAGIPEETLNTPRKSLGMQMMKILSKQLGGRLTIKNTPGATLSLEFPLERMVHSIHDA